jgi:malonate transporter and related proteins
VFGVYLMCALTMVTFTVCMTLSDRIDWNNAAFGALVATFPNTGFMGIPLLVALLGPRAAGPAIMTIVVDLVITTSLCIALSRLGAGQGGAGQAAKNALKGVASNPMPWAILSGALASWLEIKLPVPMMQTLGLLADSASPVALFTIGAVLARSQMMAHAGHVPPVPAMDYVPVALIKLILHPLLVLLVGSAAISMGLPLDRFALTVIVLVAALPSASNVSLLAEKFEANNGRIARIILVSTVLAFFSFAGVVKLVAR